MLFISLLRVFTKKFESMINYSSVIVLKNKSADVSIIFERLQNCVIKARLHLQFLLAISSAISSF